MKKLDFTEIQKFIDGKAIAKKDGKYGYIDDTGKILVPFEYDDIQEFINSKSIAMKYSNDDERYGYIDDTGKILVPFEYDDIQEFIDDKALAKKDGKYGVINEKGEILISFEYSRVEYEPSILTSEKGECLIIPNEYSNITDFKKGKKLPWGIVNEKGEILISYYLSIKDLNNGRVIAEERDFYGRNLFGMISESGEILIPFEYSKVQYAKNNKIII